MRVEFTLIRSYSEWPSGWTPKVYALWLHEWLKPFTDEPEAIVKSLNYALGSKYGGGVFFVTDDMELIATAVINRTGMSKYIPENILVYIAVSPTYRKRGIGRSLLSHVLSEFPGAFALHVEYDNPARRLYERMGFSSKYAEMRLQR